LRGPFTLRTERLGPLPIVNCFLDRIGLEGVLDKYVPTHDRRVGFPYARGLGVLLRSIIVERELRIAMKREKIQDLPIYPEERLCKRPTTEQILRLFSHAQRQILLRGERVVQVFGPDMTDLQSQVSRLLGVPTRAFHPPV